MRDGFVPLLWLLRVESMYCTEYRSMYNLVMLPTLQHRLQTHDTKTDNENTNTNAGCYVVADGNTRGVPHSKQNFAASTYFTPQL